MHCERRMLQRHFDELELRAMLHRAKSWRADAVAGRVLVETSHRRSAWHVILEPDDVMRVLVVVTAFAVESP